MISYSFRLVLVLIVCCACNDNTQQLEEEAHDVQAAPPSFTISLKPASIKIPLPDSFPFLQSFAWARQGNKILLIGGRMEGFHGRTGANIFPVKKANTSLWVIDLSDFSFSQLALDQSNPEYLQFFSSNMEFCQDGDTLYLVGGYGPETVQSPQSNYTFDRLVALSISATIKQVESKSLSDFTKAWIDTPSSPFLKVTGGELVKSNGVFYLMFGQNFSGVYDPGRTGEYTNAVRRFRLTAAGITDTTSHIDYSLHRRDLPMATVTQPAGIFYAALGGVFTKDDDGYANPLYIHLAPFKLTQDTLQQLTNNYDCAIVNIYDPASTAAVIVLLGGIGKYQYDTASRQWQHGDGRMLLPFVKSITQMKFQNGVMKQRIQLPPRDPEMPGYLGANAVFFAHPGLLYANEVIDYRKIVADTTSIGFIYGGIRSILPTSNAVYPTRVNNVIYEVFLNKRRSGE